MPLKNKSVDVLSYHVKTVYRYNDRGEKVLAMDNSGAYESLRILVPSRLLEYTDYEKHRGRVSTLQQSNFGKLKDLLWHHINNDDEEKLNQLLKADFFESFDRSIDEPNFHTQTELVTAGDVTRSQTGQYRPVIEYLALNHPNDLKEMLEFARRNLKKEEEEINEDNGREKEKEKVNNDNNDDKVIIKIKPTTLSALLNSFSFIKLGRNEKIEFGDMDLTDVSFKGAKLGKSDLTQTIGGDFAGCNVSRCEMKPEQETVAVVQTLFDALYKHSFKMGDSDDKRVKIKNLHDDYRDKLNGPDRWTAMERLHAEFTKLIDRKASGTDYDSVLSIHREPWLDIAKEIVTALGLFLAGGVPVLGYLAVASYNAYKTGRFGLFPKTTSEKMVKEMDNKLVKTIAPV